MPAIWPIVSAIFAALGPWIMRFFAAKAVLMVAGFLARAGIVLATNELLVQPIIEYCISAWNAIPADYQCWLALMGVTKIASIYVSGMTLLTAKQIFFQKA